MKRNQKKEDNDKHRSLDFGMDMGPKMGKKGKKDKKLPEMTVTDMGDPSNRDARGRSLDIDITSPYLLPAGLQGSNASIHSMSRKISDEHDPYRPVTFLKGDAESVRSGQRFGDGGSVYSASTAGASNDRAGLMANASRMSVSVPAIPKRGDSMSPTSPADAKPFDASFQTRQMHSSANRSSPPGSSRKSRSSSGDRPALGNVTESAGTRDLPMPPSPPQPEPEARVPPSRTSSAVPRIPPRSDSMPSESAAPAVNVNRASSNYGDDIRVTSATPEPYDIVPQAIAVDEKADVPVPKLQAPQPVNGQRASMIGNNRVSVVGLRPLPPKVPDDNPEQRANRIRSFYKEYFDDSAPQARAYQQEEYDLDYLRETTMYDPETNGFITGGKPQGPAKPWAQPMTRRAMTPPPRGAPRFSGNSGPRSYSGHNSAQSFGRPRGLSASGYRGTPPPRKPMPPPAPLQSLPTPHKLGADAHITNPIDFAPPSTFRNEQWGRRPDSPAGTPRPFSPSVLPHVPLAASHDDLPTMPSPYLLRKSGTFSSLDFAPPSAGFKNDSDAGSIRSNRSGISAMQHNAVRAGAYRVSRIPTDVVDTRQNLQQQLKPSWDMREKGLLGV